MSNDHYFPQTYLKKWYPKRTEMHFVLDKKTDRLGAKSSKRICSSIDNSYNKYLTPERLVENLIVPMENRLSNVISKIDNGSFISEGDRQVLTDFFIYTQFYSPAGMRLEVARRIALFCETFFYNQLPGNPDAIGESCPDGQFIPIDSLELTRNLSQNNHPLATEETKKFLQAEATKNFHQWRNGIRRENWIVLRQTGKNKFITSDHPHVLVIGKDSAGYLTPISPVSAIIRLLEKPDNNNHGSISYKLAPAEQSHTSYINEKIARAAERFVVSNSNHSLMKIRDHAKGFRTALCLRHGMQNFEYFQVSTNKKEYDFGGYLVFGEAR